MDNILEVIREGILDGDMHLVQDKVTEALESGMGAGDILNEGLIEAMAEVGKLFEEGEYFVPEMLIAARAMKAGLAILKPKLVDADIKPIGKVASGTVKGDLHDIGKNLVKMMLEGAGFSVTDLGVDLSVESLVEQIKQLKPDILGLSALLTTTMPEMQKVIEALGDEGLRDSLRIMVGGAPVDAAFAEKIGADGYGKDAAEAVRIARSLQALSKR